MQPILFKTMKYLLSRLAMFFLFMCISLMSYAQLALPRPLDGGPGTGGLEGPPEVPVDGGLSIVLAVGAGYGAKKLKEYRKKKGVESL
jgi:hypothetical protein